MIVLNVYVKSVFEICTKSVVPSANPARIVSINRVYIRPRPQSESICNLAFMMSVWRSAGTARSAWNGGQGPSDVCVERGAAVRGATDLRPENALDALLDELQTFARPPEGGGAGCADGALRPRRLHSYPSGSDTDVSPPVRARGHNPPKPPVPERHPELVALAARRAPPPPPRTTSRSPLASPTSPASPPGDPADRPPLPQPSDHSSEEENGVSRQMLLEHRHQELLKKQKALQEQYARLQMLQRSGSALPSIAQPDLKKTGSESNLLTKMNLNLAPSAVSGSMTHLAGAVAAPSPTPQPLPPDSPPAAATTNKVYETDIL